MSPPPPPPPPEPSPPPAPDVVAQLNHWWRHGKPSNKVTEAGVLVRQFDALSKVHPWEPCPEDKWCAKYRFIWPSSIINMKYNNRLYRGENEAGLILAPPPHNRFYCIYAGDGNSMGHYSQNHGCQQTQCEGWRTFDCSYTAEHMEEALTANAETLKYNEVVVDAQHMKQHLPRALLGVFWTSGSTRELATRVHGEFLKHYQMTPESFPLLHLSLDKGFSKQGVPQAG